MSAEHPKTIFGIPCLERTPADLSDAELKKEIAKTAGIIVRIYNDAADDCVTPRAYQREIVRFQTNGELAPLLSEALRRNGNDVTAIMPPGADTNSPLIRQIPVYIGSDPKPSALEYDVAKGILGISTDQLDRVLGFARFEAGVNERIHQRNLTALMPHRRPN